MFAFTAAAVQWKAAAASFACPRGARYKARMASHKLDDEEVAKRLTQLAGWTLQAGKLHREYRFGDFVEAFGFMAGAALVAERMNHHPEWFNVWSTVRIDLTTHDAGGISAKDFELAAAMERIAGALKPVTK